MENKKELVPDKSYAYKKIIINSFVAALVISLVSTLVIYLLAGNGRAFSYWKTYHLITKALSYILVIFFIFYYLFWSIVQFALLKKNKIILIFTEKDMSSRFGDSIISMSWSDYKSFVLTGFRFRLLQSTANKTGLIPISNLFNKNKIEDLIKEFKQ